MDQTQSVWASPDSADTEAADGDGAFAGRKAVAVIVTGLVAALAGTAIATALRLSSGAQPHPIGG